MRAGGAGGVVRCFILFSLANFNRKLRDDAFCILSGCLCHIVVGTYISVTLLFLRPPAGQSVRRYGVTPGVWYFIGIFIVVVLARR